MRSNNRGLWLIGGTSLLLASCGGGDQGRVPTTVAPRPVARDARVADEPVKIGAPYQVGSVTYTPADTPNYDEVGYATWYGEEVSGNQTANGETFVATGVTAAHKTLPLPSYVEVTALDTGRTILVRINDRGPFSNDKIIDLSRGAAEQLGIIGDGAAAVRVRRVNPPETERSVLRNHGRAAERLETPAPLRKVLQSRLAGRPPAARPSIATLGAKPASRSASKPALRPTMREPTSPRQAGVDFAAPPLPRGAASPDKPVAIRPVASPSAATAKVGGYVVQVAAFSSRNRAETLARRIGAKAMDADGFWRVRFGPYPTQSAAGAGVKAASAKGFENARIMANDAQ